MDITETEDGRVNFLATGAGESKVEVTAQDSKDIKEVYTPTGIRVASGRNFEELVRNLPHGLYIIDGKKVIVR